MVENKIKKAYWFVKKCAGQDIWESEAHFYFDLRNIFGVTREEWDTVFPIGITMKDKEALMF